MNKKKNTHTFLIDVVFGVAGNITAQVTAKINGIENNGSFEKHLKNLRWLTGPDNLPGLSRNGLRATC